MKESSKSIELRKIIEDVEGIIKEFDNKSKLNITAFGYDEFDTKTVDLSGGLNGWGEWDEYFNDLSRLVSKIKEKYEFWLIKMENDVPDDLFYVTFGIDLKKEK